VVRLGKAKFGLDRLRMIYGILVGLKLRFNQDWLSLRLFAAKVNQLGGGVIRGNKVVSKA